MSNTARATEQIEIVVNGDSRTVPGSMTLLELLEFAGIAPERVAIELNGAIVRKQDWAETPLKAGARLEIVQFVGGG